MSTDPGKDVDQALAKINQGESWLSKNKAWLIPTAAFLLGFILAKLV